MRAVSQCDPSTTILGYTSSIPVFISGAALAKLGHPQGASGVMRLAQQSNSMTGEINLTRGAAQTNIIQMVSSNASLSYDEIMAAAEPSQPIFFQLYKNVNDSIAEQRVKNVEKLGYKAIWLTVDALVPGNREKDIRAPWLLEEMESGKPEYYAETAAGDVQSNDAGFGTAGALIAHDDRDMTWEKARVFSFFSTFLMSRKQTIPWLRKVTTLPIVIKGAVEMFYCYLHTVD